MEIYKTAFQQLLLTLTCPRCRNIFADPVTLECKHSLCRACADGIRDQEGQDSNCCTCPLCGTKQGARVYMENRALGEVAFTANELRESVSQKSGGTTESCDDGPLGDTPSAPSNPDFPLHPQGASDEASGISQPPAKKQRASAEQCNNHHTEPDRRPEEAGTQSWDHWQPRPLQEPQAWSADSRERVLNFFITDRPSANTETIEELPVLCSNIVTLATDAAPTRKLVPILEKIMCVLEEEIRHQVLTDERMENINLLCELWKQTHSINKMLSTSTRCRSGSV